MSNMNCMINKHIQHYWRIRAHYSRYTISIIQLLKYYERDFHFSNTIVRSEYARNLEYIHNNDHLKFYMYVSTSNDFEYINTIDTSQHIMVILRDDGRKKTF